MDKRLKKENKKFKIIEILIYILIIVIFSLIFYKYIIQNIYTSEIDNKKNNLTSLYNGVNLNKKYNSIKNKKIYNIIPGKLYNSGGIWLLSGTLLKDFEIFNYDGYIGIKNKKEIKDWYIDIKNVEKYYPINNIIKLDILYDLKEKYFKVYEQEDYLPILGYHNILDNNEPIKNRSLDIKVKKIDKQLNYFTNTLGCRWFTIGDLLEKFILKEKKLPKRACSINFDDGRRNNYLLGFPILKKYGIVATFYIITDLLGYKSYMTHKQVDSLYRSGNEIGSHTLFGGSLIDSSWFTRKTGKVLKNKDIYEQISKSKEKLEKRGYIVKTFAYPLGKWTKSIVEMVKKAGYLGARDIEKSAFRKDRRTQTISYEKDRRRHLQYIKPEGKDFDIIKKYFGYNTWWQFEDGYDIISTSYTGSVRELSSYKPTKNSYGVISLGSINDEISNKFIISNSGSYIINIFGTTGFKKNQEYNMFNNIVVKIDGEIQEKYKTPISKCIFLEKRYFCNYQLKLFLAEGLHIINIKNTKSGTIYIDKFNIFREFKSKDNYNLNFYFGGK